MTKIKGLKKNFLPLLTVVFIVILSIFFFQISNNKVYKNTSYNYEFRYPKSAEIQVISAYLGDPDITEVDELAVKFASGEQLRIQIFTEEMSLPPAHLCTQNIQTESIKICFSSTSTTDLLSNPNFRSLIKSVKF